ncbi:MAG: hypothetical protein LWX70_03280 [Sphingobacteriia bacterium]|nr:hypothetical protein [Sphingobacteriia bacterium]
MRFFQELFAKAQTTGNWGIISLIIFMILTIILVSFALSLKSSYVDKMKQAPFDESEFEANDETLKKN